MSKIAPLSGFPELLPDQRVVEREVVASLSRTFELHGFANIETRVVEPLDRLAKGGEIDKEIYLLRRLQAGDDDETTPDKVLGLHFDLTVPFARYVLENAGKLEFPFRRFQIQPAWRGERPQEGRYRQFTQADIDIVGRDELPFHHDVEVMRVMVEALDALPVPALSFQVNNRKLIQGFYRGLGLPDVTAAIRVIDKLDKLPAEVVADLLVENAGASSEQAAVCLELATIRTTDTSFVAHMVQHLLLMLTAAPLLALGAPEPRLTATMHRLGIHGGVPSVSNQPAGWLAFFGALWLWHVPALYDAALRHLIVHGPAGACGGERPLLGGEGRAQRDRGPEGLVERVDRPKDGELVLVHRTPPPWTCIRPSCRRRRGA